MIPTVMKIMKRRTFTFLISAALAATFGLAQSLWAQGQFETGIRHGNQAIRIAVPDFPSQATDPTVLRFTQEFNQVLWNDLHYAGIFQMVSKSFYPEKTPTDPGSVVFDDWTVSPVSAQFLAFGNTAYINGNFVVTAYLYDVKTPANPEVLGKRYIATLNEVSTRDTAHTFANEIIEQLGGGIPGICLTQLAFVSNRTGHPEIWVTDYDGFNPHPVTSYGSLELTPAWSSDDTKLAFTSYVSGTPQITIYSFITHRLMPFPHFKGLNTTPAWSPDGKKISFCSSMSGNPEIYVANVDGTGLQRLTFGASPSTINISPAWNPKTGNQVAFVSNRSGSPQIYTMSADGTNVTRILTAGGDADAPTWSPNGMFIAFTWAVRETGNFDIYLANVGTGQITQLTHNSGSNDRPWWAPDGRHIVFQSSRSGKREIWEMLADGTEQRQLTHKGSNWDPSWSN